MTNRNEEKYCELLWYGKYDEEWFEKYFSFHSEARRKFDRVSLPFQVVETINKPRFGMQILFPEHMWPENYPRDWKNMLIWGDNKLVMSSLLRDFAGKIKLIYIDPPFFTGADFTVRTKIGENTIEKEPSIIEEKAYRDTWKGGIASYLNYMYDRLVLMRELLAEDGSIYVHLDWHVGHYVKVMMDEIFGYENFRNEIVWSYRTGGASEKCWSRKHDVILFYTKSDNYIFNTQKEKAYTKSKSRKPGVINYGAGYAEFFEDEHGVYTWVIARDVWDIPYINSQALERLDFDTQKPEALLKRIILASSNPGDIVADFFCGSGTTLAVAEKLGRRWIGVDLSKYAIQVTRKRLLDIANSKDLLNEKKKNYGLPARPFVIMNLGTYELGIWQERPDDYLVFILKLYGATPVKGFKYIYGRKGDKMVHVGPLSAPVTIEEIRNAVIECVNNKITKLDVLGWEWSYEVNDMAKKMAKSHGVDLRLIQIPGVNEIKSVLVGKSFDLRLLKLPDEVLDEKIRKEIRFVELAYLEISVNGKTYMDKPLKIKGKEVEIEITDFQLPPSPWLEEVKDSISNFADLIDYWAVDWDYKGDVFHNQWHAYRTRKRPRVELKAKKTYERPGRYRIMVKVVDVFGNDTNKVVEVVINE